MDITYLTNRLHQRLAGRVTWLLACLVALAGFAIISLANAPAAAAVDVARSVRSGACLEAPPGFSDTITTTTDCDEGSGKGLQAVITTALNVLTWITGVAAVFVLIIAGFRYVVSGGSSSGVTGAKNMIIYALIGVVIAMLAQIIVRFVVGNVDEAVETARTTCIVTPQNVEDGVNCVPPEPTDGAADKRIDCGHDVAPAGATCSWVEVEDTGPVPVQ